MKKIFSSLVLIFILISQMQMLQVYAQDVAELESQKNEGKQQLETVERIIDSTVEKLDEKIKDTQQSEQLEEKHEEIEEYIEQVQEEIQDESSTKDIQEIVEEAKKIVVLKVVSWVTEYEDIKENISTDIADTPEEIKDASEAIQDSLIWEDNDYSLIIKTQYSVKEVDKILLGFDKSTSIDLLYTVGSEKYFEVLFQKLILLQILFVQIIFLFP